MPFKSENQRRYLWAKHPKIARRWSRKYGSEVKNPFPGKGGGNVPPPFTKGRKGLDGSTEKMKAAKSEAAKRRLEMMNRKPKGK